MHSRVLRTAVAIFAASALLTLPALAQTPSKLLFSQIEVNGSVGNASADEYVVVKNPGSVAVDLSNYYLTDATFANGSQFYYNLPDASLPIGGGGFNDFVAKFPDGATLEPGAVITISLLGSDSFESTYGVSPHYELYEDAGSPDGITDMTPARPGSIVDNLSQLPSLSNSGEVVVLFYWDGASDLVTDIDYFVWGDKAEGVDKTGISIDGPDGDATASAYNPDTPVASQDGWGVSPSGPLVRVDDSEGTQPATGSNGVGGRDETGENLTTTFEIDADALPPGVEPSDTTPPTIVSVSGTAEASNVGVLFSEPVGEGAGTASNYSVYPTGSPGSALTVTAAEPGGEPTTVNLTLGSPLASLTSYTVEISGVKDVAGNTIAAASTAQFTTSGGGGGGFSVAGVFQFGPRHIGVAFSETVNGASATNAANYTLAAVGGAASRSVQSVTLQDNGQTAILVTDSDLPVSSTYQVTVGSVTSSGGGSLDSSGPFSFSTAAQTVIGIDQIHADISSLDGQDVTIVGQIFMPMTVQGSQISGYIQDGTGRGLNIFDFTTTVPSPVTSRNNVVAVSGTVDLFFTTVELTGLTVSLQADNIPELAPRVLTVPEANSSQWEGTYIQTTATLTAAPAPSGSNNHNVTASGDGADITFRVRNNTGINFNDFSAGDVVTAAGAGAAFQSTFQITVGNADEFFKGGGVDTTPPVLVSASGADAQSQVTVNFNESVGSGASTASNYTVAPTAGSPINVTGASAAGSQVTLTLGEALVGGTGYTVTVSNVADLAGNLIAANSSVSFTASGGGGGEFAVAGAFQFGPRHIGIAFSETVNGASATNAANYTLAPAGGAASRSVQSVTLQDNGQTAILITDSDLPTSSSYQVTIGAVTSNGGASLENSGPFTFSTPSQTVIGIDEIHADISSLDGQDVTIVGQIFMPMTAQGSQISGYIQDGTGRGLNLFDFTTTVPSAASSKSNVVVATGTVDLFFSTVELTGLNLTLVSGDIPELAPRVLTVPEANSSQWEGTYIQTTATLTAAPAPSGSNNHNVTASGDGADITFRIRNNTGINFNDFSSGDEVTAAGAGAAFQSTFQITVGNADDFFKGGGGVDTTPPLLVSASGNDAQSLVTVNFNESMGSGASTASNYTVAPSAQPGSPIAVTGASVNGSRVTLSLGEGLVGGTSYTVTVSNVADLAGNLIAAGSSVSFTAIGGGGSDDFQVVGLYQFGPSHIGVAFGAKFNRSQATNAANYAISPVGGAEGITIDTVNLQDNGQVAILVIDGVLPLSATYNVTVTGVTSETGGALLAGGPASFTTVNRDVIGIDAIHAGISSLDGEDVTIVGQIFMPMTPQGGQISGYIQDGTGRGLNLFDFTTSVPSAANSMNKVLMATGTIDLFFTTVELTNLSTTLLADDIPKLGPKVLTVPQANSPQWEGTYIQTTAELTSAPAPSGSNNHNATASGDGADITFRIRNNTGVNFDNFNTGDRVTAAGAGAQFQSSFQITVGNFEDFGIAGSGPPELVGASGSAGKTSVRVTFNEELDPTSARNAANYSVYPTGTPSSDLGVTSAALDEDSGNTAVNLSLASALELDVEYTVEVSGVQDLQNTPIAPGSRVVFTAKEPPLVKVRVTVPARTVIKGLAGAGEVIPIVIEGELGSRVVCRMVDLQGRVVRILTDTTFGADPTGQGPPRVDLTWDGRDESFEFVPAGMYICHAMTTDLNGKVTKDEAPVVVSVRLD